ncbi:MFS transporter [Kineococcus xinjiangensis]|uniref:MFS transporter n=1 Tax=Kineococcus xinjiangensis TaxID=512762 RepID=UPI001B80C263|nr:MFS transporter [Kineococcus xinjiangensis]
MDTGTQGQAGEEWLADPGVRRVQRRTVRLLVAAQVAGSVGMGAGPSVGVLLAERVAGSEAWAGIARTSTTAGAALLALPLAALAVRSGRGVALGTGWAVAAAGAALLVLAATTGSVVLLVLGMLAMGAGAAAQLQSRFAATDFAPGPHRARALSVVVWSSTFGAVLGPNLGAPGTRVEALLGLPPLAGAFVIGALGLAVAAVLAALLRPPPPALRPPRPVPAAGAPPRPGTAAALRIAWAVPAARAGLVALVSAHAAMVGLMTMTPVHLDHYGATVTVVGLVISVHVLGMFAFAPVVGSLADRFGRTPTALAGLAVLGAAGAVAVLAGSGTGGVAVALLLLGLGWSFVTVPAAAVVSESVPAGVRTTVQGLADMLMNLVAALAAALSGPLLALVGFPGLGVGVLLLTLPAAVLLARARP